MDDETYGKTCGLFAGTASKTTRKVSP
jgi:hypothetical protein